MIDNFLSYRLHETERMLVELGCGITRKISREEEFRRLLYLTRSVCPFGGNPSDHEA